MKKLLAIYSCCQLGNDQQMPYYIDALRSLLLQTAAMKWGDDYQIVVSGCAINEPSKNTLREYFGSRVSLNFIDDNYPVSVTFNQTVKKCVEHFGSFESYLYIDSGINFWDPSTRFDAIELFYNKFKEHQDAVIAAMPSNDDGGSWWGIRLQTGQDYIIPIGRATNLHCQMFPEAWRVAYKHILPDIFSSNCMESVFSEMAASIEKKYVITPNVSVLHLTNLDGASFGSRKPLDDRHPMSHMVDTGGLFYKKTKTIDEMYQEAKEIGFGIEECKEFWKHDPELYKDGIPIHKEALREYLAKEMYLEPANLFDYNQIQSQFYPCK
jgi:hypothetical protein